MKKIILIAFFCTCIHLIINSSEYDNHNGYSNPHLETSRKYISYEFGAKDTIKVIIAESDTICDVLIHYVSGKRISTTCPKSPILIWAFDKMPVEIKGTQVVVNNSCQPFHYQLSLHDDTCQAIVASSTLKINADDELEAKVDELRRFMVSLWYENITRQ